MALKIANRKVEEKAIRASRIPGVDKTAAVEIAPDYYLENHPMEQERSATRQEAARLLDELAALPVLDCREPDETLGYDEDGLARKHRASDSFTLKTRRSKKDGFRKGP